MTSMVQVSTAATERLLLLLGWERVRSKIRSTFYNGRRKHNKPTGEHSKVPSGEERPQHAEWERETPALRARNVGSISSAQYPVETNAGEWTSGTACTAFDAAATGTV